MESVPVASLLWIWISGLLFAAVHSGLAGLPCKSWFYKRGVTPRVYRLAYVIFSVVATAAWLIFIHRLPDHNLYSIDTPWKYPLYLVQILGLWVILLSFRPIDTAAFLGLRPFRQDIEDFVVKGIYRHVRHPMYSGFMLIMFAMPAQSANSLALYAFVAAYFIAGSRFEEARLIRTYPEYADYRKRVPAFIPHPPCCGK
jgi:protein-S-isoprenylcysteine O-methyltransferase Ste14